jgi:hypothetical protein
VANLTQNLIAPTTVGPFYVGSLPFIVVDLFTLTQRVHVEITWFSDVNVNTIVGQDNMVVTPLSSGRITLPVVGPYMSVLLTPAALTTAINGSIIQTGQAAAHSGGNPLGQVLFTARNVAIGAGVTVNLDATRVRAGMAHFAGSLGSAAGWNIAVQYLDSAGVFQYLADKQAGEPRYTGLIFIPAMPTRIVINNAAGAASVYNVALIMRPSVAGA